MTSNAVLAAQIHRVVAALSPRLTPEDVAEGAVREALAVLQARGGSIGFFEDGRVRIVFAEGYSRRLLADWGGQSIARFPALLAASQGEPTFASARDPRFDPRIDEEFGRGATVLVPLQAGGRVFGFFGISWDRVHPFDDGERELILTLAAHCGQSLERARLFAAEQRAAQELRAAERRYRAVLRATRDVIWEFDPVANRLLWNGALGPVFGYTAEETNAHPRGGSGWWLEHVHPEDRARAAGTFMAALSGGDELYVNEYRFRRADGRFVPTLDRGVLERDTHGAVSRIIGAMSDVSEQQRLLQELRQAVHVRDDFLSIASHELRTPLAALSAQLVGVRTLPLDPARKEQKLAAAERQVRRMGQLVDELLDVSRIVHGTLRLQLDEVDLATVATEAAARLADEYARAGVTLTVEAAAGIVGQWDRLRIDLVITNLLTNALRYGERQPVRLLVDRVDERGRVTVIDGGIGIRPEDHERIFERFVRLAPSEQLGGLGVGLWLARQIAQAHGGTLRVHSASGAGSRFVLELPPNP